MRFVIQLSMAMEIFTWVCCSRSSSWSLLHLEKVRTFEKDDEEKSMNILAKDMIMQRIFKEFNLIVTVSPELGWRVALPEQNRFVLNQESDKQ